MTMVLPIAFKVIQPFFTHVVNHIVRKRPELFARLGRHAQSIFIINPTDAPFNLELMPNPEAPKLTVCAKNPDAIFDARISGNFFNLLKMVDGGLDGDALFFTRDLKIEGDTEAVVCLRNALDDLDGTIIEDIISAFGPLQKPLAIILKAIRRI